MKILKLIYGSFIFVIAVVVWSGLCIARTIHEHI